MSEDKPNLYDDYLVARENNRTRRWIKILKWALIAWIVMPLVYVSIFAWLYFTDMTRLTVLNWVLFWVNAVMFIGVVITTLYTKGKLTNSLGEK